MTGGLAVGLAALPGGATAEGEPRQCPKTQGYWRNHPEEWRTATGDPIEYLWVGYERLSTEEALAALHEPPRGDRTLVFARQLIPARLNVHASVRCPELREVLPLGPGTYYSPADAWLLAAGGIGSDARDWEQDVRDIADEIPRLDPDDVPDTTLDGEAIKDTLEAYNEGELCACDLDERGGGGTDDPEPSDPPADDDRDGSDDGEEKDRKDEKNDDTGDDDDGRGNGSGNDGDGPGNGNGNGGGSGNGNGNGNGGGPP